MFHRSPSARKRIKEEDEAQKLRQNHISMMKTEIEAPNKSYQIHRFESVNLCSKSIFSAASRFNSSGLGTEVNLDESDGAWMRQDKQSVVTTLDCSMGVTPPLGKPEAIHDKSFMTMNKMQNSVTLYDRSLDVVPSVVEKNDEFDKRKGEDFTTWARRYLYGQK